LDQARCIAGRKSAPAARAGKVHVATPENLRIGLDMGTLHHLIERHGVVTARAMQDTAADKLAVNAAAAVMSEEEMRLGITHAGFAMSNLPHKAISEPVWRRKGLSTTLLIESGRSESGDLIGVPYGTLARLILLYLQTQAIRTSSPEVELGASMRAWMDRMGIGIGGRTYKLVTEQAWRISSCRLTFFTDAGDAQIRENGAFVRGAISLTGIGDTRQPSLWQDRVRLDDAFWRSLQEHPVPIREEAIRAIGNRSVAIDVYIWLAYRLHSLGRPTPITWRALQTQFGGSVKKISHFKPVFIEALKIALAVYPEASVDFTDTGIMLLPSPPAVPKAEAKRLGLG
jgi:hypothetical protein